MLEVAMNSKVLRRHEQEPAAELQVPLDLTSPQSLMTTVFEVFPLPLPTFSTFFTTSVPSTTFPNTTCFPSKCGVLVTVRKNCEPFVLGPALAMESRYGSECGMTPFSNSSANLEP